MINHDSRHAKTSWDTTILVFTDALEDKIALLADYPMFNLYCAGSIVLLIVLGILLLTNGWSVVGYPFVAFPFLVYTLIFRALIPARVMRRLTRQAGRGDLDAILEMAQVYEMGNSEIPKDREIARIWYRCAAQRGHVRAAYRLAELLRQETFNEDMKVEALAWYQFAAEHQHPDAVAWLAWAYRTGDGASVDTSLAEKYQVMADRLGNRVKKLSEKIN